VPAFEKRLTIFDLDTLEPVGTIAGVGGNGATVCQKPATGLRATIRSLRCRREDDGADQDDRSAGGLQRGRDLLRHVNDHVYIGSHPTKTMLVVEAKDGAVLAHIDLGGVPEQSIGDGKGTVYQVLQDRPGGVAVIDGKTMKVTATYPLVSTADATGSRLM
jgi:DNA-binding beta-propeller fold protein YncE